jgi:hypothetical protein
VRQCRSCVVSVQAARLSWAMFSLICAACVATPRSKTDLTRRDDALVFSGLFEAPNVELELQAKNQRTQAWERFAAVRVSDREPVLGSAGAPYFRYSKSVVLPQAPDYWIAHSAQGRIEAQVRVAYAERALPTFDADAESCARRAHDRGVLEAAAIAECASQQGAFSRVFVASCGARGEPCCASSSAAPSCSAELSCRDSVCRPPPYPVPRLADYQVDLPLPSGHVLRDAWLVLEDRAHAPGSERRLLENFRPAQGVERLFVHPNAARLRFAIDFWKPGVNRFHVRGFATRGDRRRSIETPAQSFEYTLPRQLGFSADGRFQLPAEHFPRAMRDCQNTFCKDADGDGLNDLWENVAAEQLRPRLMLDAGDRLFTRQGDVVRVLTSVVPFDQRGQAYVLFANVVAFTRDYGHLGLFDHAGDTEAFGMLFKVEEGDTLRWVASAAKGHACLTCAPRFSWYAQEFATDGTPLVYVERDKHGLWQNGRSCREHAAFSCKGERMLRPSAINIGDYSPDGSRGLIDGLDGLNPNGPFAELVGVFPGDAIWSKGRARVNGRFCGGAVGCSVRNSANQPGLVIAGLLELFQRKMFGAETASPTRIQ